MNRIKLTIFIFVISVTGLSCILFLYCTRNSPDGRIIITQVPGKLKDMNYITGDSWRYFLQAQIVSIDPDDPEESPAVLTEGFYSANSPEISYDGRYMLFAAQQNQNDPWQIWEMDLKNSKTKQVIVSPENCIDPAYLPGNRLLFSKLTHNDSLKAGHSLYTCNRDGSDERRITFNPNTYFAPTVLNDGRILTISKQIYPEQGKGIFMVLRPDGTKAELFYDGVNNSILSGRGKETINGRIVFPESDIRNPGCGDLISISYNRPLHTRINLTSEADGDFRSAYTQKSGKMLVTWRKSENDRYALYEFDPGKGIPGEVVYANPDFDIPEAVVAEERVSPKRLPSEVDTGVKTGLLLCQDINVLDPLLQANALPSKKASKIEVLGLNTSYGTVDVESDGSFYLKAMADTPFRLQSLDENGNVIYGPCAWIFLRPNERRGCVGCHEDMELVPENRIPLSVKKAPVTLPVHIEKIKEKTVELE